MIAFRKSPRETGILVCRGKRCPSGGRPQPISAFEPRADSLYGRRRLCRECRRPIYQRYESRRRDLRLERHIATVPAGPELKALGKEVLNSNELRFILALTCRLEAGTYERDARGRPIIPATLKAWADRLGYHRAEVFCRRELDLPDLPAQKRHFVNRNPIYYFCALLREQRQQEKAQLWAEKQAEWAESRQIKRENHPPRRKKHWDPYLPTDPPRRTVEEMEYERKMAMPRPDGTLATEPGDRSSATLPPRGGEPPSPSQLESEARSPEPEVQAKRIPLDEGPVRNNPAIILPLPANDIPPHKAISFTRPWGPAPGSPEDTAALAAAGLPPRRTDPTPEPSRQADCRGDGAMARPRTKDEVHAALAAGKINESLARALIDSIDLSTGPGRKLRAR